MFEEIKQLVIDMVKIPSVNTTSGEKDIAVFIEKWLRRLPYFEAHPGQIYIQPLSNDSLGRRNVFALIKGTKKPEKSLTAGNPVPTIIFHGHTDTVGIEDFGAYKELAFNPQALMEAYKNADLDKETKKDLLSGDYLFGRGATDMKDGNAVFMVVAKYFSENLDSFAGNILLSFNPVEENLHTGIIQAGSFFKNLAKKENLKYIFAINNDYTCPLYPGDTHKYIYTGSVGKLLPCFYIQGKETHVGQCFEGIDSTMVASELVRQVNLNPEFCDSYNGESTLPPAVLKCQDLKDFYNVQTAFSNFVYFNYMVHADSVIEIEKKLIAVAKKSWKAVLKLHREHYKNFCRKAKIKESPIQYSFLVLTFKELKEIAEKNAGISLDAQIRELCLKELEANVDKREIGLHIVQFLCKSAKLTIPLIVLFFAPPYCPHNTLKFEISEEAQLYQDMKDFIEDFGKENDIDFKILNFYPSLTDSSFIKIDDDKDSISRLMEDFPEYEQLYPADLHGIKELNIPGFNFGGFGKDAHKKTERVYMPYTFKILPELEIQAVKKFLK